jgi:hypothetical protein
MNATAPVPVTGGTTAPAIENEIPAYRAISPRAVAALILGVLSVLAFADWRFLVLSALAVVLGWTADRNIQRWPDVLTGRRLAQAGVGLGLIFGLTSVSIATVQGMIRKNQAQAHAKEYLDHVKKDTIEQLMWLNQPPTARANSTPEAIAERLRKNDESKQRFEMEFAGVRALQAAVHEPGAEIHYEGIETHGEDGLSPFAGALFEIHNDQAKKAENKERHAFVLMKAAKNPKNQYEWYVESVQFPYKKKSFALPDKPVDDGHGH